MKTKSQWGAVAMLAAFLAIGFEAKANDFYKVRPSA